MVTSRLYCMVSSDYIERSVTKSIHKLSAVREVGIHKGWEYVNGYGAVKVPKEVAYFAHLRLRGSGASFMKYCKHQEIQ